MAIGRTEELLILAKTYPNPSSKHREITCIAAVNRQRELRRLFPLPFRYLQGDQKFQKWEWITARIAKASKDHRPESHTIDSDSIVRIGRISTKGSWRDRLIWIDGHSHANPEELEAKRQSHGITLGFIRPKRIVGLDISKSNQPEWTEEEKRKLMQEWLFDSKEVEDKIMLRKVPYDFYYRYECEVDGETKVFRHKITDWEAGALYWNCRRSTGDNWEVPFRERLEREFRDAKDVFLLMGTMHRFPDKWLIVSLHYPPKGADFSAERQLTLL